MKKEWITNDGMTKKWMENKWSKKPAVVAEQLRACVKFKEMLTQRPRFESRSKQVLRIK